MKSKAARNIYIFLIALLGLSAIGGGGALIISPSGKLLGGLPLSILKDSPFTSFLIPGIILFVVLGLSPGLLVIALLTKPTSKIADKLNFFKDMHWSWSFSIYVSFALIIWLQVEAIYIQSVGWLQTLYMFFAISILFMALLAQVKNFYRQ